VNVRPGPVQENEAVDEAVRANVVRDWKKWRNI
jgi:hypothetical protein